MLSSRFLDAQKIWNRSPNFTGALHFGAPLRNGLESGVKK